MEKELLDEDRMGLPATVVNEVLPVSPAESAKIAGLRYVTANLRGFGRRRAGKGWVYLDTRGQVLREQREIERIKSLVIPPAWAAVWICPDSNGHLQALGIDAKGRKQYLYHPLYREVRDATKYGRMAAFGGVLPSIRKRVESDLRLSGLPRNKVLAAVVQLLERISVRIGNEEYARDNESFGITTLRNKHVEVEGSKVRLQFIGKSGKEHEIEFTDRRLARIVAECQDLPGQELFQYLDEGQPSKICSDDVNAYLHEITGDDFTAKDFRTWNGSREAMIALYGAGKAESATEGKRKVAEAVKMVACALRNRPAVCRKYYVHPALMEAYEDATLFSAFDRAKAGSGPYALTREENALMKLIGNYSPRQAIRRIRRIHSQVA